MSDSPLKFTPRESSLCTRSFCVFLCQGHLWPGQVSFIHHPMLGAGVERGAVSSGGCLSAHVASRVSPPEEAETGPAVFHFAAWRLPRH